MFERFTGRARHVVVLAQEEARELHHNYIGTEHILLALLAEEQGLAFQVLSSGFGMSHDGAKKEVVAAVGIGNAEAKGHIPFTPRAKKTLELALREALQLSHNYIGTEHILLGVLREGDGVGGKILKQHADPTALRSLVLDHLSAAGVEVAKGRRWLRRHSAASPGESGPSTEQTVLSATPAADTTLAEAARLAGAQPVGSHHLLLAALTDPNSAAARALAALGIDLDQAQGALKTMDVTGTSDEQPEEAGRRQMVIHVAEGGVTIEATDPVIIRAAQRAVQALGDEAAPDGTIRGDLPVAASLSGVWQALHDSLAMIHRRATLPSESPEDSDQSGSEVA